MKFRIGIRKCVDNAGNRLICAVVDNGKPFLRAIPGSDFESVRLVKDGQWEDGDAVSEGAFNIKTDVEIKNFIDALTENYCIVEANMWEGYLEYDINQDDVHGVRIKKVEK